MKKVLALVLAVMMLATVAFADVTIGVDGTTVGSNLEPGDKILLYPNAFVKDTTAMDSGAILSNEYFTVTAKKFTSGGTLVADVKINDDKNRVEIVTKENYDLTAPKAENLVVEFVKIKCKKDVPNTSIKKGTTWVYDENNLASGAVKFKVGYLISEVPLDDTDIEVAVDTLPNSSYTKFVKRAAPATDEDYATATINFGDTATATGRVYKNDKVYLGYNEDVNVDIVKKYPDAELSFVEFEGTPTFNSTMALEIYADEDQYIYEIKDGKIATTALKWDDDAYAFTGKVRTLGAYVISDTKLNPEATTTGNPDTGANDVVGIATALAAVALVSAAAVSLKK